jgi:hypothetical protein
MRLPWQKENVGGGMRMSQGWKKNIHPRRRLLDQLSELEREDPESARRGGTPVFTSEEFQSRRGQR